MWSRAIEANIISFILKVRNLSTTGPAAYYKFVHRWDFWTFYSNIVFNNQWLWTSDRRIEFINIMIHELGHALGIPHKKTKESVQEPTFYPAHQCHEASSTFTVTQAEDPLKFFYLIINQLGHSRY